MRAILSVSDKDGLVDLGRGLVALGVELVSTGGTATALAAAGLPVVNVSDVTRFPEMMDGRVKTLHPAIHAGILARRHRPDDLAAIASHAITPVDLVVVNLYPFVKAAQNPDASFDQLVEEIDIGGPSLLRAAGKNFRDVLVVVDPKDYPRVLEELGRDAGPTLDFRFELMQKAFAHTAMFDGIVTMAMRSVTLKDGVFTRKPLPISHGARRDLRYGENPHQKAYWLQPPENSGPPWEVHQGKELSYTNLLDLDAAVRIALEFTEPVGVVIKHTNPCGVATGSTQVDAYVRAREADPLSAFGGIVGLNRPLDVETAKALTSTFIEAVIAPSLAEGALAILAAKQNLRVVTADYDMLRKTPQSGSMESRTFLGGFLVAGARPRRGGGRALAGRRLPEGRDTANADSRGVDRAPVRMESVRAREIEHDCLHWSRSNARGRRRPDESCRRGEGRRDESGARFSCGISGCVRRLLSVPRRPRRPGRRRRHRCRTAGRIGA